MIRILSISLRVLTLLIVLLLAAIVLVLNNEKLTHWALIEASDYIPGFSIDDSQGTLWQGLNLDGIRYRQDGLDISAHNILIHVDGVSLLRGKLMVNTLTTDQLHIRIFEKAQPVDEEAESREPFTLPHISTPIHIGLLKLSLRNSALSLYEQSFPLDELNLAAFWRGDVLAINHANAKTGEYRAELTGNLYMQSDWPLNVSAKWFAPIPQEWANFLPSPNGQGRINVRGTIKALSIDQELEQPIKLGGMIKLWLFDEPMRFDLQQAWQAFVLSVNEDVIDIKPGNISLSGNLDAYNLALETALLYQPWPQLNVSVYANGNDQSAQLQQLLIENGESQILLTGNITWLPNMSWDVTGQLKSINPAIVLEDLPGAINALIKSQGSFADKLNMAVQLSELSGQLRDYPLSGFVDVGIRDSSQINIDSNIRLADNILSAKGSINNQYALDVLFTGADLNQLWPELSGSLHIDAQLRGNQQQPLLNATVSGDNIAFNDYLIEKLDSNISSDLLQKNMRGELTIAQLTIGNNELLTSALLTFDGNNTNHHITLQLDHPQASTGLRVRGSYIDNIWQAKLSNWFIKGELAGTWLQQQTTKIVLSAEKSSVEKLCLQQQDNSGYLCLLANKEAENISAKLDLQHIVLAPFAILVGPDTEIQGVLSANAEFSQRNGKTLANAKIDASNGTIRLLEDEEESLRISWQDFNAEASLKDNQYHALFNFVMDANNSITANAKGRLGDNASIDGQLAMHFDQLHWLEMFAPVQDVKGYLTGKMRISGRLDNPDVRGQLNLHDASLSSEDAGISLDNIGIMIDARSDGSILINGKLYSDGKALVLDGYADRSQLFPWPISLSIKGEDILLLNIPEAVVRVDPDIAILIANQIIQVRGKVLVRQANITLRELPTSVVSVSSDAVIVGDEQEQTLWATDVDVTVVLGNNVSVEGMGLSAKFTGDVRIEEKPQRPLLVTGLVRIIDGRYRAYGQNLRIERGNLYFQGPPDDPGLDVVASRTVNAYNAKAGLEIAGTLKNPQSRIFSEPAMDETDAMSLLLTGKPLSGASESEGNAILQAIVVYGIEQGDFITNRISDTLGIDVGFDTEGETNEAAFMMGKQLSPRLYLRYSVSLFESISTFMLRYSLSRHINLETRTSGQNQSVDLIYRRER